MLIIFTIFCTGSKHCQKESFPFMDVADSNNSRGVNYVGDNFIDAVKQHVIYNYAGNDLFNEVKRAPFLFYYHDRVFKMNIDIIIPYNDSLFAVRFHGALDTAISFNCHSCSAPQALGVFVQRGSVYFPKEVVDVSDAFRWPWGASSHLELHFENSFWPGPMLFSTYTDGGLGNYYQYTHGIDLSSGSLGFERFRFSNTIRLEKVYLPEDDSINSEFPIDKVPQGWKEAYKITEVDLNQLFHENNASFDIVRNTNTHWTVSYGPNEEHQLKILVAEFQDTLNFTLHGGIYAPL